MSLCGCWRGMVPCIGNPRYVRVLPSRATGTRCLQLGGGPRGGPDGPNDQEIESEVELRWWNVAVAQHGAGQAQRVAEPKQRFAQEGQRLAKRERFVAEPDRLRAQ